MFLKKKIYPFSAPPEITVEKSWVHASEGYDVELACIVHGEVTSEVMNTAYIETYMPIKKIYIYKKKTDELVSKLISLGRNRPSIYAN